MDYHTVIEAVDVERRRVVFSQDFPMELVWLGGGLVYGTSEDSATGSLTLTIFRLTFTAPGDRRANWLRWDLRDRGRGQREIPK